MGKHINCTVLPQRDSIETGYPLCSFLSALMNGASLSRLSCSEVREIIAGAGGGELSTLRTPCGMHFLGCCLHPSSEKDWWATDILRGPVVGGHLDKLFGVST